MLPFPLSALNEAALNSVCAERISESETLDFKAELTGRDDKGKAELAKDVSAMANADGGDLVFGIREDKDGGAAETIAPISAETFDEAHRRIRSTLDAWVEPKVLGLQIHEIKVSGGYAIVIRIPKSLTGPHCVRHNSQRRFAIRNGTQASDMSFDQLRYSFDRTSSLVERARKIFDDRLAIYVNKKSPRNFLPGPIAVVHVIPIASISDRVRVDIAELNKTCWADFSPAAWASGDMYRTVTLDGCVVHKTGDSGTLGATTIFRDGQLENVFVVGREQSGEHTLGSGTIRKYFWQSMDKSFKLAAHVDIAGPALVRFSILHTSGYTLQVPSNCWGAGEGDCDRPHLVFPDLRIDDISMPPDPKELIKPTMDIVWQSYDFPKALDEDPNY